MWLYVLIPEQDRISEECAALEKERVLLVLVLVRNTILPNIFEILSLLSKAFDWIVATIKG